MKLVRRAILISVGCAFILTAQARQPWVTLKDCRYVKNPSDDGDSFHVRVGRKETIFRLYFVDAPETDRSLGLRLDEQAKYFGITVPQTLKVGEAAKDFAREKLSQPFVVRTCYQDALGRSRLERFYAFVQTKTGDLSEDLVRNGLARLHGASAKPEGLNNPEREWEKLERLEHTAKEEKVGGWGVNFGRLSVRAAKQQTKSDAEAFEEFFHPQQAAPSPTPIAAAVATPSSSASSGPENKIDINTASKEQLEALPGVGPVIADRIMADRPFKSADDLRKVKGIGDKRYDKLRPYFD